MNQTDPATAPRSRRAWPWLVLALLVLALAGWRAWSAWQARQVHAHAIEQAADQRIAALEQRLEALRRDQRAQTQRIVDAAATNRVLRDEVLGLSQRGALLEDSVSKLADPTRHGAQALRLDEAELLLSQARQRLDIADDLDGARRAYALADGVLRGVDDPRLLNLRQALAQERSALERLGEGPHANVAASLDALAKAFDALPERAPAVAPDHLPAWQRMLSPLVQVRRTQDRVAIAPDVRATGKAAVQVELALARAALERDDAPAFHACLDRIGQWLPRLWPETPALAAQRKRLQSLREARLQPQLPELGSTLEQLRRLRNSGTTASAPEPVP